MKDSKNQAVCARCHFTGDASAQDCTIMSSGVSGLHRPSVRWRTVRKRSATFNCCCVETVVLILDNPLLPLSLDTNPSFRLMPLSIRLAPAQQTSLTMLHNMVL